MCIRDRWYSTQIDRIPQVMKEPALENVPTLVVSLQSNKVDVILLDRPTAEGVVTANSDLVICPMDGENNFNTTKNEVAVSIALPKGEEALLADLNEAIAQIPAEELDQMVKDACAHQPLETNQEDVAVLSFFEMVELVVRQYGPLFLQGAGIATFLALAGTILGTVIGCITGAVAAFPIDPDSSFLKKGLLKAAHGLVAFYVWLFRGTPMMVQMCIRDSNYTARKAKLQVFSG